MIGLVILGHGSNVKDYRIVVERHRERIERLGLFDEVRTAYVIEEPKLEDVLKKMRSDRIFVVPLFIAYGEHLKEIEKRIDDERVVMCRPIGYSDLVTLAIILSAVNVLNLG